MKKEDEYWRFVTMAMTSPSINKKYYYDIKNNELFGLKYQANNTEVIVGNQYMDNRNVIKYIMSKNLKAYYIVELPRIDVMAKSSFIQNYLQSNNIQGILEGDIDTLVNTDFSKRLNFLSREQMFDFDSVRTKFLEEKIASMYLKFGMDEETTKVVW
ncbi:MAG: hypothetical protein MUF42_02920 [Cytophagaceae bacterium]|jgi:hypothetical protein|nr:hypothetical protein [Cytophagaceae bacterium]